MGTPTTNFLNAAKQANRKPTVLMRIQAADATEFFYTTKSDWDGSDTLTFVRTTPDTGGLGAFDEADQLGVDGDVWHKAQEGIYDSRAGDLSYFVLNLPVDGLIERVVPFAQVFSPALIGNYNTRARFRDSTSAPTETFYSEEQIIQWELAGSIYQFASGYSAFPVRYQEITSGLWYVDVQYYNGSTWVTADVSINAGLNDYAALYTTSTAQVVTSAIDAGSVLSTGPTFSVDDIAPEGSSVSYSYTYSDNDISYSSGGTISDGDTLTASRYYKITIDFSTTDATRALVKEIIITVGAFKDIGTHKDKPIIGVKPYLTNDPISSLTQKIDIRKGLSTTGEMTVKMFWTEYLSDIIATGYLKGKDVTIYVGFEELSLDDYYKIFVGTWYDNDFNEDRRIITVKCRDILKQFEKRKLPQETYDSTGTKTSSDITYTTTHFITVMLDIYDRIGVRDRYIHTDYATLRDTKYTGTEWYVSRVLSAPRDSFKLLDELAQTGSMWLVPLGDGQIKPVPFDINKTANSEFKIGNGVGDFGPISGNLKEFYSRYYSYYNPTTGVTDPGDSVDDFDNGTAYFNVTAELNWSPEKGQKDFFDKWKVGRTAAGTALTAPPKALRKLNKTRDHLFTEGLKSLKVSNLPPRFAGLEIGDVIPVDGLLLPVPSGAYAAGTTYSKGDEITSGGYVFKSLQDSNTGNTPIDSPTWWVYKEILDTGLTDEKRFLVIGKTYQPAKAIIELEILEMPLPTFTGGYASLKVVDGSTAQTGIGTTPVLMTGWAVNGTSSGSTPDHTTDKITIGADGTYRISFNNNFNGTSSAVFEFHLRVNSIEQDEGAHRKIDAAGDTGSCSFSAIVDLLDGDEITVYVESDAAGRSMTPIDSQLTINQIA